MRIAILNREASAYPGGDHLSILDIQHALADLGIESKLMQGAWTPDALANFDLVHIRHINFGWSHFNIKQAMASKKPYVITPMFYPRLDLGMNQNEIKQAVDHAAMILPFSEREWIEMQMMTGCRHEKVRYVPNGTDERFWGLDADFGRIGVLSVAARTHDKNVDLIADVCKELLIPFLGATGVPSELMPNLYRRARVFVNASESERMSRTIGEGLVAGCRVLATEHNRGNTWYPGLITFDPANRGELTRLLKSAYRADDWDYAPNRWARALTWRRVAGMLKDAYEEVLHA